jgi:hypothetical protein
MGWASSFSRTAVVANDELVVEGDLTDPAVLVQSGDWFRIITPCTLDSSTGEQHEDVWKHHPREGMWAGYQDPVRLPMES